METKRPRIYIMRSKSRIFTFRPVKHGRSETALYGVQQPSLTQRLKSVFEAKSETPPEYQ